MSIDAMKQALEALELAHPRFGIATEKHKQAITALRAAIEQIHTSADSNTHQCKQEPVAWAVELPDGTRKPLYTAPHQPLTDKQLRAVIISGEYDSMEEFARVIEAAHGIGKK